MQLSELQLDEKHIEALKHCPANIRESVKQLIRFYANFTRANTIDDAFQELGSEFMNLTMPKPPDKRAKVEESQRKRPDR